MTLGVSDKIEDAVSTTLGIANDDTANRADFMTFITKLTNDSLRLNKGTQTEGDAQRARNELFENLNDEKIVVSRLEELMRINQRAIKNRRRAINRRRANEGVDAFDFSAYDNVKFKEVD